MSECQLVTNVTGKQFITASASHDHFVTALYLTQQIIQRQDDGTDRQFIEILDNVTELGQQVDIFLRIYHKQSCSCALNDLAREEGLIAFRVGIIAVVGNIRLCYT